VPAAHERLRVLFVNRYYAPDLSATSQMLTDLAEGLARSGVEVSVLCSRQLYEDPQAALPPQEVIRGVQVWRVRSARFGRSRLGGRALDYATFYLAATAALLRHARACDVLVMKTDPPLLSLIGAFVARRRGVACVNWLQDVFPEIASRLSLSPLPQVLESRLAAWRDRSLRTAAANVVLGTRMRDYLASRGVPLTRLSVGENWADEHTVARLAPGASALRARLGLTDRFVVAYSGNLGRAHDVDTLLAAAEALRADPTTVFLMTGGGVNMRALESAARQRGLHQLRFLPYQPRAQLADSLAAGDVHLVMLLPQLEGLIVPSKLYGILAAGRPVIFVGDRCGELAQLISESEIGLTVACGDGAGLCAALSRLRDDPQARERMGARARALFEERYTLALALARWRSLLAQAAAHAAAQRTMASGAGSFRSKSHS
jgi:glycosyltransferase involved in cell wall biosynthesis